MDAANFEREFVWGGIFWVTVLTTAGFYKIQPPVLLFLLNNNNGRGVETKSKENNVILCIVIALLVQRPGPNKINICLLIYVESFWLS